MSQRQVGQLRLVFSSSRRNLKISALSPPRPRMSRAGFWPTPLFAKLARLRRSNPAAAVVVEKLVDDILAGLPSWMPPLE